jgi:hypothetical protein
MEVQKLQDVAIVVRPGKDNVAVVTADFIEKDTRLKHGGKTLTISGRVLRGLCHHAHQTWPTLHHAGRSHWTRVAHSQSRGSH